MISPRQAQYIIANWMPLRYHADNQNPIGLQEKCVLPEILNSAGITLEALESEAGGMYVGRDNYAEKQTVYTFDVKATEKRAAMNHAEYESVKKMCERMR